MKTNDLLQAIASCPASLTWQSSAAMTRMMRRRGSFLRHVELIQTGWTALTRLEELCTERAEEQNVLAWDHQEIQEGSGEGSGGEEAC